MADIAEVLRAARSPNDQLRKQAEQRLESYQKTNFAAFMLGLAGFLANPKADGADRALASLILKNSLSANTEELNAVRANAWIGLPAEVKGKIKGFISGTLGDADKMSRRGAAQALSAIALIELPRKEWPGLIDALLQNMLKSPNPRLKECTLQSIGYICKKISPEVIGAEANKILTAVIQGARKDTTDKDVKLAAMGALFSSLEFIKGNFKTPKERSFIMQVICEATQFPDEQVAVAAFECLVEIASLYYGYLPQYMQAVFNITLKAMKSGPEPVVQQAIEFWSTICEEEIYLSEEANAAEESGIPFEKKNLNFVKGALRFLIPPLTVVLAKQEEDQDEDTWNGSMAAATCISLIANTVLDDVVPAIMPFITRNMGSENWRLREAAIMAFGSILEGPEKGIKKLVSQALPTLIKHLKDPVPLVKDTTAWSLGRICDLHPGAVSPKLKSLMNALVDGLNESPRVATHVCWAIHNLAEAYEDHSDKTTSPMSAFFKTVVGKLLKVIDRTDIAVSNFRPAAYEAIGMLIATAAKDCNSTILTWVPPFLEKLDATFKMPRSNIIEIETQAEIQGLLCGVLQMVAQKLEDGIRPYANKMMQLFLQVFNSKNTSVHEEALMAIGSVANAVGSNFERYMSHFRPILSYALKNIDNYEVCAVAVGVVGDMSRSLGEKMFPYCDEIIALFLMNLQNPALNRSVKPTIISCIGDIALSIGGHFDKYLTVILSMLKQAATTQAKDPTDLEFVDYVNELREGILEAYTGIIQGLRTDSKAHLFESEASYVIAFIDHLWKDSTRSEAVSRGAVGLLGDIVHSLHAKVKPLVQKESIRNIVETSLGSKNSRTRDVAKWTKQMISKLNQ